MPSLSFLARCAPVIGLLAGCAPVGPDHQVPEIDVPASFSSGSVRWQASRLDASPKPQDWWKLFGDAELNALVASALDRNQELKVSAARLREAREGSAMARSRYFPAVEMDSHASRERFRFRGPGGGSNIQNSYSVPVDLRYELDVWGKVRRMVEEAGASEEAARELWAAQRLSIAAETAQTYWVLRAVDADRAVLARTLQVRHRAFDLLTKRQQAGAISGLDLARAKTELASAEVDRLQLEQTRAELVHALAVLCGAVATGSQVTENATLPSPPKIPVSLPSQVLRQRPDVRAAERNVAAANARIGVATAAFLPSFSLNAATGLDAVTVNELFEASSLVWSLGGSALTPLTNLRFLHAQRRAVVAQQEAASAEYRQTVLESIREVENALRAAVVLQQRQAVQEQALSAARDTFALSVKRFENGLVSFLDVVDAERVRLEAERAAHAIRGERLAVSVALAKAVGGEW
jgi:outer membrane protein, multidrug efflux system